VLLANGAASHERATRGFRLVEEPCGFRFGNGERGRAANTVGVGGRFRFCGCRSCRGTPTLFKVKSCDQRLEAPAWTP